MSAAPDRASGGQVERALDMLEALAGEALRGLSNKELAEQLRCPPSYVTRTAEALIAKGWVEKDEASGRFRITSRFGRLTARVMGAFDRAEAQLAQTRRNYTLTD